MQHIPTPETCQVTACHFQVSISTRRDHKSRVLVKLDSGLGVEIGCEASCFTLRHLVRPFERCTERPFGSPPPPLDPRRCHGHGEDEVERLETCMLANVELPDVVKNSLA